MLWEYPAKVHYSDTALAVRFWDAVAGRYGKRRHVLFEMYNESADQSAPFKWAEWRPTGETLIATIRRHSDNIILGPGVNYTGDLTEVPENPYSDRNLVYTERSRVSVFRLSTISIERGFTGLPSSIILRIRIRRCSNATGSRSTNSGIW